MPWSPTSTTRWSLLAASTVIPAGGTAPSGSTSCRPRATIACRTVPGRPRSGVCPKASWAMVPHDRVGLVCTSMTSATRVKASVRRPATTWRCRGSVPSRMDSPSRSSSTRPTSSVPNAQSRLAEFPPVTIVIGCPTRVSTRSTSPESWSILSWSGTMPLRHARLVPSPASRSPARPATAAASSTTSSTATPSRRSPSSTISTTSCETRRRRAATDSASSTTRSVLRLMSLLRTTRSTWLSIGDRISVRGVMRSAVRRRSRFSIRESPMHVAPPRTIAAAIALDPSEALDTPVTRMPRGASRSTSTRVFCAMRSRSTSSRGAVTERPGRGAPRAPGTPAAPCRPDGRGGGSTDRSPAVRARAPGSRWPG